MTCRRRSPERRRIISTRTESMSSTAHRRARPHHRLRDRRQQRRLPPHPARLDGRRPGRQRPAAEPRRLHRARLELHLPRRPLEGDDAAHRRQHEPVPGDGRLHRVRGDRGRAHRGAMEELRRRMASAKAWGIEPDRSSHRQRSRSSSRTSTSRSCSEASTTPRRRCRRLAARRDDHARARHRDGRADRLRQHRGPRDGRRGRPDPPRRDLARGRSRPRRS